MKWDAAMFGYLHRTLDAVGCDTRAVVRCLREHSTQWSGGSDCWPDQESTRHGGVSSAHPTDFSLLRAGSEVTKKRGDDGIDDSHIVEAQDLVQRGRLRNRIRDQTQYAHLLLETLASLEQRGATPARSKTIKRNSTGSFPRQTKRTRDARVSSARVSRVQPGSV